MKTTLVKTAACVAVLATILFTAGCSSVSSDTGITGQERLQNQRAQNAGYQ